MNFRKAFKQYQPMFTPEETVYAELEQVRKSIRKRNRNLILISISIFTILALLVIYVTGPLQNRIYYNPMTKEYEKFAYDVDLSLVAYTELHMPGYYHSDTIIENTGAGKYTMTLMRYNLMKNEEEYTTASLNKNRLALPFSFTANSMPLNLFAKPSFPNATLDPASQARYINRLKELPHYIAVTATVSFPEDLTMNQLVQLMEDSNVDELDFLWATIREAPGESLRNPLFGMDLSTSGIVYEKINEKYKSFELSGINSTDGITPAQYEEHFKSLLKFSIDHPEFLNALEKGNYFISSYESVLDYVEKNGVKTYGVLVKGSAAEILKLAEFSNATQVWPLDADIRLY